MIDTAEQKTVNLIQRARALVQSQFGYTQVKNDALVAQVALILASQMAAGNAGDPLPTPRPAFDGPKDFTR